MSFHRTNDLRDSELILLEQYLKANAGLDADDTWSQDKVGLTNAKVEEGLLLAIHLATALAEIHQRRNVHGALHPTTILFATHPMQVPLNNPVRILEPDLTLALDLNQQLSYAAPEQTGRLNWPIDQRTDLYTIGVLYYQLFTGRLPFVTDEPLRLVHAHIATAPTPPAQLSPRLPVPISDIIAKLLIKEPSERYQSTAGVLADLNRCLKEWRASHSIAPFTLGEFDVGDHLLLPNRLYGKKNEWKQALDGLNRILQGASEMFILTGDAGIGKTTLLGEMEAVARDRGATVLTYRADHQAQAITYATISGLLTDFIQQLCARPAEQVKTWQSRLVGAFAGNMAPLLRTIPALTLLYDQPEERHAELTDMQHRLSVSLQKFLALIAEFEQPVVMIVDDAHHADLESLQLMRTLIQDYPWPVGIVWVYCNGSIDEKFSAILNEASSSELSSSNLLHLSPLTVDDTCCLLQDTFHAPYKSIGELAKLLHTKTLGNPFFLREFLRSLVDQRLIYFDGQQRTWNWDLEKIESAPLADNVVEIVLPRLQSLPLVAQEMLKVAALLDNWFTAEQLSTICQQPLETIGQNLQQAQQLGVLATLSPMFAATNMGAEQTSDQRSLSFQELVVRFVPVAGKPEDGGNHPGRFARNGAQPTNKPRPAGSFQFYHFTHDQVRAAARRLLPQLTESTLYVQLGKRLWQRMTPEQRQEKIFLLVRALNHSRASEIDWAERITIAQANLQAGRRALERMVYDNALTFAQTGIEWLGKDLNTQAPPDLRRNLYLTAAQAAARLGRINEANQLFATAEAQTTSLLDRAALTQERMIALYLQGKHQEAIDEALLTLRLLGVHLPRRPNKAHVGVAMLRTQLRLPGKYTARLTRLPPMTDAHKIKALELLVTTTISAATVAPLLLVLIGLEIVWQTLKHGSHPLSAMGYALYGVLLCGVTGQIERGYAFGQLALQLAPQIAAKEYRVFVKYFVHAHINHWKEPIQATLQPLRDLAITVEFEYLGLAAGLYPYLTWFINGMDLPTSERVIADSMYLIKAYQGTPLYYRYQLGQQIYQNLLGLAPQPAQLRGNVYDETAMLPIHLRENDQTTIFYLACHKVMLGYLFADYAAAIEAAQLALAHQAGGVGTPLIPIWVFYDSLARLALCSSPIDATARQHLKVVAANQRKMRRWAKHSPANCQHRYSLVAAEEARLRGDQTHAREHYDAAIAHATTHDYLPELAVAHEVAARFYLGTGQNGYAEHHLREARRCYGQWGASGKIQQLEQNYPQLRTETPVAEQAAHGGLSAYLDMAGVLKATQIFSAEATISRLLDTLITILVENAGAQVGALFVPNESTWRVVSQMPGRTEQESPITPTATVVQLVQQAADRQSPLLLNNVATDLPHAVDPYMHRVQPRSILCLPLLDHGKVIGVVYLEHRLTRQAFAPERLPLLTTLAGQAAISLKNAQLVAGLEQAQQNIQASETRFRLLFDNAPLGLLEIDLTGETPRILTANQRAEALFGWSAAELTALDPEMLVPEESQDDIQTLIERVRSGKTALLTSVSQRRDGLRFPVRVIATPAPEANGLQMIVALEDITAQQQRRSEVEAIEEERRRIAQEIHDGVAQNLAFLRLKLALWRDWIAQEPARMPSELQQAETMLDDSLVEMRRSISALRPLALETNGLLPVLRQYVADLNEQHDLYVTLHLDISEEQVSTDLELPIFRVIQEALNNVIQHAQASLAWVELAMDDDAAIRLTIRDNGKGFDEVMLQQFVRDGHLGLIQMHERIVKVGGQFSLTSQPEKGTEIQIKLYPSSTETL